MSIVEEKIIDGVRWISAKEAASVSGLSRDHITRLCRTGKLNAQQIAKVWYVEEPSLHHFLLEADQRREEQATQLSAIRAQEYHKQAETESVAKKVQTISSVSIVPVTSRLVPALRAFSVSFGTAVVSVIYPISI